MICADRGASFQIVGKVYTINLPSSAPKIEYMFNIFIAVINL